MGNYYYVKRKTNRDEKNTYYVDMHSCIISRFLGFPDGGKISLEFDIADTYSTSFGYNAFHMNMGNSHNGWYGESNSAYFPTHEYQYYRKNLYNIRKNN